jgi:hypothetical protein
MKLSLSLSVKKASPLFCLILVSESVLFDFFARPNSRGVAFSALRHSKILISFSLYLSALSFLIFKTFSS